LIPEHATVGWFVPGAKVAAPMPSPPAKTGGEGGRRPDEGASVSATKVSKKSFAERTTRKVLRNGIIVDVIENHTVPTVAIRGLVFAGDSAAPAGKPAVADLTARMLTRGTKTRTKEQIGALLDVRKWPAGGTRVAFEWRPQ